MTRIRSILAVISFVFCTLLIFAANDSSLSAIALNKEDFEGTNTDDYVFRRSWGGEGDVIVWPRDIAIGANGIIYVTNRGLNRITAISPGERIYSNWGGSGSEAGQFDYLGGIAVNGNGDIYVVDRGNRRIQKFSGDGTYLTQWGSEGKGEGQFEYPEGITVDENGDVYVVDTDNHRIQKFSGDGTYLSQWGSKGGGNGQFRFPADIAVDKKGDVYVTDSSNHRVQKFSSNGSYLAKWGSRGNGIGQFTWPGGIAIDGKSHIIVDSGDDRVQKFSDTGAYFAQWGGRGSEDGQFDGLAGIAVDGNDNIYVVDSGNHRIQKLSSEGAYLAQWGGKGSGDGPFPYYFRALAADGNDDVYVVDAMNSGIHKFSGDGTYLTAWGGGPGVGRFFSLGDVAADGSGNVYVADSGNDRIQKFTGDGTNLTRWGSRGSGDGQFNGPSAVAVAENYEVYVVDQYNRRIQKFTSDGAYLSQWPNGDPPNIASVRSIAVDGNDDVYAVNEYYIHIQKFRGNGVPLIRWGSYGSGDGQFYEPVDIAVDGSDNVYVVDEGGTYENKPRVQKFNKNGIYLTKWGSFGGGAGQFNEPNGIAVDSKGDVYVADSGNHRIQKFTSGYLTPDPVSGLVQNGSFELSSDLTEWAVGGRLPVERAGIARHGRYAIKLGVPVAQVQQDLGEAWAHQTFYVDPNWTQPQLSFKYRMFVNDILHYSDFFVAIQDGVGLNHMATVLRDGYQPCIPGVAPRPGTDLGWRTASYDLSPFKGQHIRIVFSNRNLWPQAWGIWTYVDDVRVVDAGPVMPLDGPYFGYLPTIQTQSCDPVPAYKSSQAMIERAFTP